jgi:hypothetical protein
MSLTHVVEMERKQGKRKSILKSSLAANAGHYAVLFWSVLSSPVQSREM